jgi:alpha-D-ribose 1-methylphosphonate 5-triphosphate synthase subunit PhnI
METKKYSSYAQIERELEILKIEKEINYQKLVFSIQKTKENLTPKSMINSFLGSYSNLFSGSYGTIINLIISFIVQWICNKKRGN